MYVVGKVGNLVRNANPDNMWIHDDLLEAGSSHSQSVVGGYFMVFYIY